MEKNVDIKAFLYDLKKLRNELIPRAVVLGFRRTAKYGRDAAAERTKTVFNLHSEYIPRGIMFLPDKPRQVNAAIKGFSGRHKDFEASVFVRGANNVKKDLGFMVLHETGGYKKSHSGKLAVPAEDLKKYRYQTGKGATKKSWKPEQLLKYYNTHGPVEKGSKQHGKSRKGKPKAFILKSKHGKGTMIARRVHHKSRKLEILYRFIDTADIDKRWDFVKTIHTQVLRHLGPEVRKRFNSIRLKKRR